MDENEFYSVLKLTSGEEIIAKVSPCHEDDRTILILDKPIVVKDIVMTRMGIKAYRVEPWIKVVDEDMFFINMDSVITMTEVSDPETIQMYRRYIKDTVKDRSTSRTKPSKSMGYVSSVEEYKDILENLYKSS